ncbi:MAG: hypothetical protein LBC62_03775 [Treponema sp.]|jgi:hypothetical protein|nr:hypothetical protein [Treponema sp.]
MKDSDELSKVFRALSRDNQACLLQCARIVKEAAGKSVRTGGGPGTRGPDSAKTRKTKKRP